MFGEDLTGESPRLPSPWQALDAASSHVVRGKPTAYEQQAAKAMEILRLDHPSHLKLAPETDHEGQIEYKLRLAASSQERFGKLVSQLKWRLLEGGGTCLYELGVLDDGQLVGLPADEMSSTLETLQNMASELDCQVEILREIQLDSADDVHLMAKRATVEGDSMDRPRTISTSVVVNGSIQHEYDTIGSQKGPTTTALVEDTPSSTKTQTEPINIAPVKRAVGQAAAARRQKCRDEVEDVPLSSSFSLNSLVRKDSFNDSGESTRASTPLRMLPAGRRYCLEVRVTKEGSEDEPAFLNFEGWSME